MPLARYALYRQGPQIWVAPTADDSDGWIAHMRAIAIESGRVRRRRPAVHPALGVPGRLPARPARARGLRPRRRGRRRADLGRDRRRPALRRGGHARARLRPARRAARQALVRRGRALQPRRGAVAAGIGGRRPR